jgi:hypothetical protein
MYDSVDPYSIPTNVQMVAGYIDGTTYRWPESVWNRFSQAIRVRIARRVTTNDGHVLDVESGIPTVWPPSQAIVDWVLMRRKAGIEPTIYCNQLNDWNTIRSLFRNAGVVEPNYWVARYNNVQEIPTGAIAKQYANPPLSGGHFDLSVVADYWPGVDRDGADVNLTDGVEGDYDVQDCLRELVPGEAGKRHGGGLHGKVGDIQVKVNSIESAVEGQQERIDLAYQSVQALIVQVNDQQELIQRMYELLTGSGVEVVPSGSITLQARTS